MNYHLLQYIEVCHQIPSIARLPIGFVAHQQNIWTELSKAGQLHETPNSLLEGDVIDYVVESLDLPSHQPFVSLLQSRLPQLVVHLAALNISHNHQRIIFRDQVGKVDKGSSGEGFSSEDQDIWMEILHVISLSLQFQSGS